MGEEERRLQGAVAASESAAPWKMLSWKDRAAPQGRRPVDPVGRRRAPVRPPGRA